MNAIGLLFAALSWDRLDKLDFIVAELPSVTKEQTMWTTKCIDMNCLGFIDLLSFSWQQKKPRKKLQNDTNNKKV